MKTFITCIFLFLIIGCKNITTKPSKQESNEYSFYVGTYTDKESQGIYKYILQNDGTLKEVGLAAVSNNPTFLAMSKDRKFLVASNEIKNEAGVGTVESFSISADSLKFINKSTSGGANPCFININESGYVLTANYSSGTVGLLKLNKTGELSPILDVLQHVGNRKEASKKKAHAHSAWFNPDDDNVITVDLGTNELWFSNLNTELHKLVPTKQRFLKMETGAGPRHLARHPNSKWIYVVNELNNTVTLIQQNSKGEYEKRSSVSTLPTDYSEISYCADIHISKDGKFVYASNRGHNSISIFSVNPQNGLLNLVGIEFIQGDWPRNFSLSPDENYLLVANQHSKNIVSFKRNKTTGLLTYVDQIEAPTPTCILF